MVDITIIIAKRGWKIKAEATIIEGLGKIKRVIVEWGKKGPKMTNMIKT